MILSQAEMFIWINQFLTFKTKIKYHSQMPWIRNHYGEVFTRYVRRKAEQEAVRIRRRETDSDTLSNCWTPRSQEIIFDWWAGAEINADFLKIKFNLKIIIQNKFYLWGEPTISANRSLECTPTTVTCIAVVSFSACSIVQTWVWVTAANTIGRYPI